MKYCTAVSVEHVSPKGYHRHKCKKCRTVWEHSDRKAGNEDAHKCPNCSEEEWYKYFGSCAPTILKPKRKPIKRQT